MLYINMQHFQNDSEILPAGLAPERDETKQETIDLKTFRYYSRDIH